MASGSPPPEHGRAADDVFRDLIEGLDAFNYVVRMNRPDDVRIYVNSVTEQALGLGRGDLNISSATLHRYNHPEDRERVTKRLAEASALGGFEMEYRLLPPNGYVKWIQHTARMTPAEGHRPALLFGYICDVTRDRLDYDALRRSERRYRDLVERLPAIIYVDSNDEDTTSLYVSPEVQSVIGYTPAEWSSDGFWPATMHPDDRDRVLEQWARSVATAIPFATEYRYIHKSGHSVWVRDTATAIHDTQGKIVFWQGVIQDIGDRKRAEEDLRHSESRYRALIELVPAVVYEMGPDDERRTLYVSPHVQKILGYSRQEWLDQPDIWIELLHPDDREIELAAHDELTETHQPWLREYRLIASDGRVVWVRDQGQLVRDAHGAETWHGVMLDITAEKSAEDALLAAKDDLEFRVLARTAELEEANEMMSLEIGERRRVEAELRGAEERFRLLVEQLPAVVYVWDVGAARTGATNRGYMSPQIEQLLGYTPVEWVGNVLWRERVHPHDRERILQIADETARTGASYTEEYRYLAKDGRVVWVIDQVGLLERDDRGTPLLLQGVMLDVTDRREAEAKVAEIENWYRHITDESPAMTWVVSGRVDDPNVRWSNFYVSRSSRRLLGYEPEEMTPGWRAFLHPDDDERVARENQVAWKTGAPWTSEYRMIAKDGRVIWIHLEGRAIDMDEHGAPSSYQAVMMDVTAQKDREARLIEEGRAGKALLDGMPAIAWTRLADKDGRPSRLIYISAQASSWLGYSPEELLADPELDSKMTHPEDVGAVTRRMGEFGASGMLQMTNRVICKDGQIRWFQTTARRSPAEVGVPQVWQGVTVPLDPDLLPGSPRGWPDSQDSAAPGPTTPGPGFLE